jgi:hypothetical protein
LAKIKEIAGVIGETLRLSPSTVDGHLRGLLAAERIARDEMAPIEVADLLAACLCTDHDNATAAFHLPFAGAECSSAFIEPFAEDLAAYRANAGQVLALHLDPTAMQFGCAERLTIDGSAGALRCIIEAMAPCFGKLRLWFGYRTLPALAEPPRQGVLESRSISGFALRRIVKALKVEAAEHSYSKFLRASLDLNYPPQHSMTLH